MSTISLSVDLERIKSVAPEKQSLFLFNAFSTHYRNIAVLDSTLIVAQASALLEDLTIALRAPGLHRAHRNLLGRCFVITFRRAEKSPFEATSRILQLLQRDRDERFKWNATVVLGIIFENVGDQIVSLLGELVVSLARLLKSSSTTPALKTAALHTVGAALSTNTNLDEANSKEILKILKVSLPDKTAVVQRAAYDVRTTISGTNRTNPTSA